MVIFYVNDTKKIPKLVKTRFYIYIIINRYKKNVNSKKKFLVIKNKNHSLQIYLLFKNFLVLAKGKLQRKGVAGFMYLRTKISPS